MRELQNVLHRYVTLGHLVLEDVGGRCVAAEHGATVAGPPGSGDRLADAVGRFEKEFFLGQLQEQRWHVSRSAAVLGG